MIKAAFLGDVCLNNKYIGFRKNGDKPFSSVGNLLSHSDFVIGNIECFARGDHGVNMKKKPYIHTEAETLGYLLDMHLNIASLANNHVFDNLEDGFRKTVDFLDQNNILHLGAAIDGTNDHTFLQIEKGNIKIGFLNYVTGDTNPNPPADTRIRLSEFNEDKAVEEIRKYKQTVDHLVILLHWGGKVEGGLYPDFEQPGIGRRLIDTGADMVIGHHSHTIHPYEIYKGKYIFYSLGNFCFSPFTFEGHDYFLTRRRRMAMVPVCSFSKNEISVTLNYYFNNNGKLVEKPKYQRVVSLRNFLFAHFVSKPLIWSVYYRYFKYILPFYLFLIRKDISLAEKLRHFNFSKLAKFFKKR